MYLKIGNNIVKKKFYFFEEFAYQEVCYAF